MVCWPRRSSEPCHYCQCVFRTIPACLVRPTPVRSIYGLFCSWNCAKRKLLLFGNRAWFASLAISALRSGAQLPISIYDKSCIPVRVPYDQVFVIQSLHIQQKAVEDDNQMPVVFSKIKRLNSSRR